MYIIQYMYNVGDWFLKQPNVKVASNYQWRHLNAQSNALKGPSAISSLGNAKLGIS